MVLIPIVPALAAVQASTILSWTSNASAGASTSGSTFVQITPVSITAFSSFRLTIRNSASTPAVITNLYIGEYAGSGVDFGAAPVEVKFGGTSGFTFTSAHQEHVSDWTTYNHTSATAKLCLSWAIPAAGTPMSSAANNTSTAGYAVWRDPGSSVASTPNKTEANFSAQTYFRALVTKVEAL